jgi:hypothetical protein
MFPPGGLNFFFFLISPRVSFMSYVLVLFIMRLLFCFFCFFRRTVGKSKSWDLVKKSFHVL